MKRMTILGSTGSIGTQTLEIIRDNPEEYSVYALTCGKNRQLLAEQIAEFRPVRAAILAEADAEALRERFPEVEILAGSEGIREIASDPAADMVLNALVGISGLVPTYHALQAGNTIALANKETLVCGGSLIMGLSEEKDIPILPVDSEHSAVFQCLQGFEEKQVKRIILTASGGPFRGKTREELAGMTAAQALQHPNWSMGSKVTIDSSTLMNKGFEVMEARWLFDMPPERIDVVVHPESIIHSMVEYEDHAVMAQLGTPDMKVPISYAMGYPYRIANNMEPLDLVAAGTLHFEKPDMETFRCLQLAFDALRAGGTYCAALNAADEVMVGAFLEGKAGFTDIQDILERVLDLHKPGSGNDLEAILHADAEARRLAEQLLENR